MHYQHVALPTGATMDVFAPISPLNPPLLHKAIVICPGGGYSPLAMREAEPIALRFAGMGYAAFIVYYHIGTGTFPQPQQDVACAIAAVREHAEIWQVDPNAVAVAGFSAGGHLAASMGVMWHRQDLWQPLGLTCEQVKPNALLLSYPVITAGEYAHRGSFECLTGSMDAADHQPYSLEHLVSAQTPPTFLWHTWEDVSVPVQNSLLFALALKKHGVQAEVHIYPYGSHGSALCNALTASEPSKLVPEAQEWPEKADRCLNSVLS